MKLQGIKIFLGEQNKLQEYNYLKKSFIFGIKYYNGQSLKFTKNL